MSGTQSDAHGSLPGSQKLGRGRREGKGTEDWIKLRGKYEERGNRKRGRKEGKEERKEEEMERGEKGKRGGEKDKGEEGKGGENKDRVTRHHPAWPRVPFNFIL